MKYFFGIVCLGFGIAFSAVATFDILTNDERFTGPVWVPGLSGSMFLLGGFLLSAVDAEQRLISVSTSLTSASISATSCGVMCGNRCDILDGTASIGNDSTAELAAGGLVFTKSEDIEMLSKDLFISMKEIRVKYHFAGIDSDPPRSALSLARGRRKHRCTKVPNCAAPRQAIVKKGLTVLASGGH